MKEIESVWEMGSEFVSLPQGIRNNNLITCDKRWQYVLSGRTALDLVARDIRETTAAKTIALPSYCCESMVLPFVRNDYNISFYDVLCSDTGVCRNIPLDGSFDVVLIIDYFGFISSETKSCIESLKKAGRIVIYDDVQSCFSETESRDLADYSTVSWRKWFFSCAAAARKENGPWKVAVDRNTNENYIRIREKAAQQKNEYLKTGRGNKTQFLNDFRKAEEILTNKYENYTADSRSMEMLQMLDTSFLKQQRRKNAVAIYDALESMSDNRIRPLFKYLRNGDIPLFVPVLITPELRMNLRDYLIKHQVYCPIHWLDLKSGGGQDLYMQELSLICDQRYDIADIKREMSLIKEFFTCYA